jgi:integrase
MSRQIFRLTETQIRNARPIEEVIAPEGADHALATARKHPRMRLAVGNPPVPIQHQDVRDGRIVQRKTRWLADGGSLWVKVMPSQSHDDPDGCSKSYVFRYSLPEERTSRNGKTYQRQRQHGLGPCHTLTLAEAREAARECRKMILAGIDPIVAKQGKAAAAVIAEKQTKTFDVVVDEFLLANGDRWSKVHRRNWVQSLRDYVSPVLGKVPISAVDTQLAIQAITGLYDQHKVTAARVMGRCADVYSYAVLHGYALDPNPFRYKGHLEFRFPHQTEAEHLPSLKFDRLPAFMAKLRAVGGLAALATEWTIINVSRTNETRAALASEIDWERQEWRVPKSHKKTRRHMEDDDFIVPLTDSAMAILAKIGPREPGERLFPLPAQAMLWCVKDINSEISVHGFRATFKTWSLECTETDPIVVKACMSHKVGTAVDRAYHRGPQFLEKRRRHMQLWSNYCDGITETADNVVPLRA